MAISEYLTDGSLSITNLSGKPDVGTRYQGGANRASSPFIKGWFQVFFGLPSTIFQGSGLAAETAGSYLTSTAISFQPPSDPTINYADIQGQGGVDSSVLTGIQMDRSFSLTFNEQYGSPIWKIFEAWCGYLNPYFGISTIGETFAGNEYKGEVWVIETRPIFNVEASKVKEKTIEKVFIFDGVFPTNNPLGSFDSNVAGGETLQISVNFRFDGRPVTESTDSTVIATAEKLLEEANLYIPTKNRYESLTKDTSVTSGISRDVEDY